MVDYLTVADMRARFPDPFSDTGKYPNQRVQDAIDLAAESFEHAADVAFSPRTETLDLAASSRTQIQLPRARVISVDTIVGSTSGSVTLDGRIVAGCLFENANAWTAGETLTVTFTHGYPTAPLEVVFAVGLLARKRILRGDLDDRATQLQEANGGIVNLATPGMFGAEFGIPDVDAVLRRYRESALFA